MESKNEKIIIVLLVVIIALFAIYILKPPGTGWIVQLPDCLDECCVEDSGFKVKQCSADYECIQAKCKAIDTDEDGLSDIEEREIGTDVSKYDTDNDGLSDYREYKEIGTNPLNDNTDGDRYKDGEDREPLKKNTAQIIYEIKNLEWELDVIATLGDLLNLNADAKVATGKADIFLENTGNDYTSYVEWQIVFYIIDNDIKKFDEQVGKMDVGETLLRHYEYEFRLGDVPRTLWDMITSQSTDAGARIENLRYEKY